ncbi:exonuclease SbcC [Desulfobotulus alkaliphilus]|uniref:Exonuclease SbcC n=1 Tax=Desulfobotulus alkaliphilus TaxID=622671 RepID=A0A562RHP9_9BACT|nr:AAA family ATPase [Desulfobotulus alkaliphilus]TWI68615.1 exonuclease SbcC [Desulfobotulus alkaliphilus]
MKILSVSFENLNSLTGRWSIDFTHPSFVADGIFAITGPTGAGKSTILDAICLALYGCTPRLEKVNKSTNEIMSRQTGTCSAEVRFETGAGTFRCHWSQHRARRKHDGALQNARHEFVDENLPDSVMTGLSEVPLRVEEVTGMDFKRFTRSMMLAQGAFAAFLEASSDDRSTILEQITGTGIYGEISMRVHGRLALEKKKLEELSAGLKNLVLMSREEVQEQEKKREENLLLEKDLKAAFRLKTEAFAWLKGLSVLEEELTRIAGEKEALEVRQQDFEPEAKKLKRAMLALELSGMYAALTSLRREEQRDAESQAQRLGEMPLCEKACRDAEKMLEEAEQALGLIRTSFAEQQPVFRRVRELDLRMDEKRPPFTAALRSLEELEKKMAACLGEQKKDEKKRLKAAGLFDETDAWLKRQAADASLVTDLTGIEARLDALQDIHGKSLSVLKAVDQAEKKAALAEKDRVKKSKDLEKAEAKALALQAVLDEKQAELEKLLQEKELGAWRDQVWELKEKQAFFDALGQSFSDAAALKKESLDLKHQEEGLLRAEKELGLSMEKAEAEKAVLEREAGLLETQLLLLRRIQDMEEARTRLEDGKPCPLCGSVEHPYAKENLPLPDAAEEELKKLRKDLKLVEKRLMALGVKEAELRKDKEQLVLKKRKTLGDQELTEQKIQRAMEALAWKESPEKLENVLPLMGEENRGLQQSVQERVGAAEILEKEILKDKKDAEKLLKTTADCRDSLRDAKYLKEAALTEVKHLQAELQEINTRYREISDGLAGVLALYGISSPEAASPEAASLEAASLEVVRQELVFRKREWMAREKNRQTLMAEIQTLDLRLEHHAAEKLRLDGEKQEAEKTIFRLKEEMEALSGKRSELLGDRNPDTEEALILKGIEKAEKHKADRSKALQDAFQQREGLRQRLFDLEEARRLRAGPLAEAEGNFVSKLPDAGFQDEKDYQGACLGEEERKSLMQEAEKLQKEETELLLRRKEKTALLEAEREKALTETPAPELQDAIARLEGDLTRLQQETGAIGQRLVDHAKQKEAYQREKDAEELQKKICSRWGDLHVLIGSADGKKFRNFAQGLTFEYMLGYANRQLEKMTDRYLLTRNVASPLELCVVDSYQAGEIRSTKNLSGGERFIVSLALALGLSGMSSRNIRVDSLFLDEGFGTLDEEALDMALETLSALHKDGRLIGIISHVSSIRERMASRIQVIPGPGGRSRIQGPGCGQPE